MLQMIIRQNSSVFLQGFSTLPTRFYPHGAKSISVLSYTKRFRCGSMQPNIDVIYTSDSFSVTCVDLENDWSRFDAVLRGVDLLLCNILIIPEIWRMSMVF